MSPVGMYGRLATIRSNGAWGTRGASRSPSTNVTATPSRSALPRATSSAAVETSLANTDAPPSSLASVTAMAPEPVPTSATRGWGMLARRARASSTSVSVSGRGTRTRPSTAKSSPQNSFLPTR